MQSAFQQHSVTKSLDTRRKTAHRTQQASEAAHMARSPERFRTTHAQGYTILKTRIPKTRLPKTLNRASTVLASSCKQLANLPAIVGQLQSALQLFSRHGFSRFSGSCGASAKQQKCGLGSCPPHTLRAAPLANNYRATKG